MYIYRARHHTNTRLLLYIHELIFYFFISGPDHFNTRLLHMYTYIYIYTHEPIFYFLFQDLVASYGHDNYILVKFEDFLPGFKGVSTQFWAETHELKAAYDRGAMRTPPTTQRTYAMPGTASGLEQC